MNTLDRKRRRPLCGGIPRLYLRLVVGGLLLVFGLQWLRKAVLRALVLATSLWKAIAGPW